MAFDKNPFTKYEVALTFDPEIKSLHHWVQLEPSTFMSRQSVTPSLMIFFFLELKFEHIFLSSLLNKTAGLCQI